MLLVQEYLKSHSLSELESEHHVKFRIKDHKFGLNYDTVEASDSNPIACECRGLVLQHFHKTLTDRDVVGDTVVLAHPMHRFFNFGQGCAANIDFENDQSVKYYEKLDGTMTAFYWDPVKNEWHVATRSIPEADLPIDGFGELTFRELFNLAFSRSVADFNEFVKSDVLDKSKTYIFELCTPVNQVVVKHEDYSVTLLAVRSNECGTEHEIEDFIKHGLPVCKTYSLSSFDDMIEFVGSRDPKQHEGIVAVNDKFQRVKVKNPEYMAISKIRDSIQSPRTVVQLMLQGRLDDVLAHLPDLVVPKIVSIQEGVREVIPNFDKAYDQALINAQVAADANGWDFRKALAITSKSSDYFEYIMYKYTRGFNNFEEFAELQFHKETQSYKKSFLDKLLKLSEKE